MVVAVRRYFDAEGIEPANFYYERFAVGAAKVLATAGAA